MYWLRYLIGQRRIAEAIFLLARFSKHGRPPAEVAKGLQEVYRGRIEHHIAQDLWRALQEGQQLTAALRPWLPAHLSVMLRANTGARDFSDKLESIARQMRDTQSLGWRLGARLVYPLTVIAGLVAVLIGVINTEISPLLREVADTSIWTWQTQLLVGLSSHLASYWIWWLAAIIASTVLVGTSPHWLPTTVFAVCVRVWPAHAWYQLHCSRMLESLAVAVLQGGYTWGEAARQLQPTSQPWGRVLLEDFRTNLDRGWTLGKALAHWQGLSRGGSWQLRAVTGEADFAELAIGIAHYENDAAIRSLMRAAESLRFLLNLLASVGVLLTFTGSWGLTEAFGVG